VRRGSGAGTDEGWGAANASWRGMERRANGVSAAEQTRATRTDSGSGRRDLQGLFDQLAVVPVDQAPVQVQHWPLFDHALSQVNGSMNAVLVVELILFLVHAGVVMLEVVVEVSSHSRAKRPDIRDGSREGDGGRFRRLCRCTNPGDSTRIGCEHPMVMLGHVLVRVLPGHNMAGQKSDKHDDDDHVGDVPVEVKGTDNATANERHDDD